MSDYDIYVFCNECSAVHSAELRIELQYGLAYKKSVGDLYSGEELPTILTSLENSYYQCSKYFFKKIKIKYSLCQFKSNIRNCNCAIFGFLESYSKLLKAHDIFRFRYAT